MSAEARVPSQWRPAAGAPAARARELRNGAALGLAALAAAFALYGAFAALARAPAFALRELRLAAAPVRVAPADLQAAARAALGSNFFTLDLEAARAAFERVAWVRRVALRRRWPDALELAIEEHVPLARWGAGALVNTHGELFEAPTAEPLPRFAGPPAAAKEIAIQYEYFRRTLAPAGLRLEEVEVSPRRAWRLRLEGGLTLELGREQLETRLARFVSAYAAARRAAGPFEHADLRYGNGFAVRAAVPGRRSAPRRGRARRRTVT